MSLIIKRIIVLAEPWAGNGVPSRGNTTVPRVGGENDAHDEGETNSPGFNNMILAAVDEAREQEHETLILIPYSYHSHAVNMAIHIKNHGSDGTAIYLDPRGNSRFPLGKKKPEILALQEQLTNRNFAIHNVDTVQQPIPTLICAFVSTASLFKFIEEFLTIGNITVDGFVSPKPNVKTAYLFQMYINNWQFEENLNYPILANEIMIADTHLWTDFIEEQNLREEKTLIASVSDTITQQHLLLAEIFRTESETTPLNQLKLNFVRDLQQKFIELFFIKPESLVNDIEELRQLSNALMASTTLAEFTFLYSRDKLKLVNLTSNELIDDTKRTLKLMPSTSTCEQAITHESFSQILSSYHSTSSLSTSRLFCHDRSVAIRELRKLSNIEQVSKKEIEHAISKDSSRRLTLFQLAQEPCSDQTGTDKVILELGKVFRFIHTFVGRTE